MEETFHRHDISQTQHFTDTTFHSQDISWTWHFIEKSVHSYDILQARHFIDINVATPKLLVQTVQICKRHSTMLCCVSHVFVIKTESKVGVQMDRFTCRNSYSSQCNLSNCTFQKVCINDLEQIRLNLRGQLSLRG